MSLDLQRILDSKRAFRQRLAARPIAEKLRMLDELRERAVTLRSATAPPAPASDILREKPTPYRAPAAESLTASRRPLAPPVGL